MLDSLKCLSRLVDVAQLTWLLRISYTGFGGGAFVGDNKRPFLTFIVDQADEGQWLSSILRNRYGLSRGMLRRLKRPDSLKVDGEPSFVKRRVHAGQKVSLFVSDSMKSIVIPQPIPISILYEDEHLIALDKPPGMLVHPAGPHLGGTLANGVAHHLESQGLTSAAGPVTRLDKDTSGVVLFAKHPHVHHLLSQMLKRAGKQQSIDRTYIALAEGVIPKDSGIIDAPIAHLWEFRPRRIIDSSGRPARTRFRVLGRYSTSLSLPKGMTLLCVKLFTGRTHQIRVHMAHLGYPLVGDPLYGSDQSDLIERQGLHARRLSFIHPMTGRLLKLTSPLPNDMRRLIEKKLS